jgi:hypothetical protein
MRAASLTVTVAMLVPLTACREREKTPATATNIGKKPAPAEHTALIEYMKTF